MSLAPTRGGEPTLALSLTWTIPPSMAVKNGHEWRSIVARGIDQTLPAELFHTTNRNALRRVRFIPAIEHAAAYGGALQGTALPGVRIDDTDQSLRVPMRLDTAHETHRYHVTIDTRHGTLTFEDGQPLSDADLRVLIERTSAAANGAPMSPFRFDADGTSVRITAWTLPASKLLETLIMRLHRVVSAWTQQHAGVDPTLSVGTSPMTIEPTERIWRYSCHALVAAPNALPADHAWRAPGAAQDPDLLARIEATIQRDIARQADVLGIDIPQLAVMVSQIQHLGADNCQFDGAPKANMLVARGVTIGIAARLTGPWAVGAMASRGYGLLKPQFRT